ncbi:MAG: MFS transporter [Anaerolineales bacterium]|nr:MFS transporter [Anaerolineales bacterium]
MIKSTGNPKTKNLFLALRGGISLTFIFLLIEFFDELNYGIGNAALPAMRTDLALSYVQIGLLLGLPHVIGSLIEPLIMLLGDTRLRKRLVIGGGAAITLTLLAIALGRSFPPLLVAMIIGFPASGAFVTLSQATLMDANPGREAQMMARWTVAGSVANLLGPLLLAGIFTLGYSWRWAFGGLAVACLLLVLLVLPRRFPVCKTSEKPAQDGAAQGEAHGLLAGLWRAVKNRRLLRWFILLQLSDLLLDVLTGYLPLYFTDVAGLSIAQSSLLLSVLMLAGLAADTALIPILERFSGRRVVRHSAALVAVLYAAWLLAPWLWAKIGLIVLIKLSTLGWYQVLQGEAFAELRGRSGTVMALNSVFGLTAGGIAWLIGWIAAQAGLPAAMWVLLLGPLSLALFVPTKRQVEARDSE